MPHRIGTNALLSMLGDWRRSAGDSLHGRLTTAFVAAIETGVLIPGTRLPSERTLARALGVSRATVTTALNDAKARGHLDARHGSGTIVCGALGTGPEGAKVLPGLLGEFGGIDLAASSPSDAGSLPDVDVNLEALLGAGPPHGYVPAGLPELRNAVAERFTLSGLPTTSRQVVVTNGAQHALALAFSQLTNRGDSILVDEPTCPG
ncbi:MAG: aminotransferase class I/II-fold pyridoxal phosphate-dependent enzyme [Acidimicrobiales bacterium]